MRSVRDSRIYSPRPLTMRARPKSNRGSSMNSSMMDPPVPASHDNVRDNSLMVCHMPEDRVHEVGVPRISLRLAGVDGAGDLVDVSTQGRQLPDAFPKGIEIVIQ